MGLPLLSASKVFFLRSSTHHRPRWCLLALERLNMPAKLKPILEQSQVRGIRFGSSGLDLGEDSCESEAMNRAGHGGSEVLDAPHSYREWNARAAGNCLQIGASGRGRREASNGNQALVIENDVEQSLRPVARESAKAA